MKKLNLYNLVFAALLTAFSFSIAKAQQPQFDDDSSQNAAGNQNSAKNRRQSMLAQLGLSDEQIRQIRRVNADKKPSMRAAQQRLREANRRLDQALYADNDDDAEVQTRIKEVQTAQAEVIKIRATTETAVRRILTVEQLGRFRELRRQFAAQVDERREEERQMRRIDAPARRQKRRQQRQQRQRFF